MGGKRLDRCILYKNNNKLLQCEIKNWAAGALGGKTLKVDADDKEIKKVIEHYWKHQLNNDLSSRFKHPSGVTKVLLKMKPPKDKNILKVEPLLIYWMPISTNNKLNPLSNIRVPRLRLPMETLFSRLHIFSVSLYLRRLYKRGKGRKIIDLDMPHFKHRMKILNRFQNKK